MPRYNMLHNKPTATAKFRQLNNYTLKKIKFILYVRFRKGTVKKLKVK